MRRASKPWTNKIAEPDDRRTTRSKSWKMSERGWCTDSRTRRFPRARRDRVITRLWAVKLSSPDVGSSRIKIPEKDMGGEPQFGNKGESLTDGEVRKEPVVLADVSDAFLHQLRRVGLPVDQDLTGRHCPALIPTVCAVVPAPLVPLSFTVSSPSSVVRLQSS
ncbi:hypothetical protein INR49_007708 [Caranx melampygus]|nr:hypothetical protein INR49_007708 [Caranx melampygus]